MHQASSLDSGDLGSCRLPLVSPKRGSLTINARHACNKDHGEDRLQGRPSDDDRALGRLVDLIGVELCRPLATLRDGVAARLSDGYATESDSSTVQCLSLLEHCDDLRALTADYVRFVRVSQGREPLALDWTSLREFVRELQHRHEGAVRASNHEWRCELLGDDTTIGTDIAACHVIFDHLVSNACKYTPPGGRIAIEAHYDQASWTVCVVDQGAGIPAEILVAPIVPFRRAPTDGCSNSAGNGLGLALCDALATHLGGALVLESAAGQGTRAALTLPLKHARAQLSKRDAV